MKTIIKIALFFVAFSIVSCSSDDSNSGGGSYTPVVYAMKGTLDGGTAKLMRNAGGTNLGNPNSTEFGISYFTLNGYYDNGSPNAKAPIQDRVVEVNLVIPKNNISLGEHLFNNTLVTDEYFADMNIKLNNVNETVNTVSGKINVITYESLTGQITGTYEFTTTDGVTAQTHSIVGEFDYKVIE